MPPTPHHSLNAARGQPTFKYTIGIGGDVDRCGNTRAGSIPMKKYSPMKDMAAARRLIAWRQK